MYLCRFFCPNTTQDSITWAYENAVTHEIHMARQARDPFFTFTMGDNENPRQKSSVWNYGETVSQSWSFNLNTCIRYLVIYHSSKHLVRGLSSKYRYQTHQEYQFPFRLMFGIHASRVKQ